MLQPVLLGDPGLKISPLHAGLEAQAQALKGLAVGGVVAAPIAGEALLEQVRHGTHVQRAAALTAAKLMVDRDAAGAFFAARPVLLEGPAAVLPKLGVPADPYRGSLDDHATVLGRLAHVAGDDAATGWLFDGASEGLRLEGLSMDGKKVWTNFLDQDSRLGKIKLKDDAGLFVGPHPHLIGSTLLIEGAGDHHSRLSRERGLTESLADVGAGPRWLGSGTLPGGRRVGVKETVYGATLSELMDTGGYETEAHQAVLALFEKLARARLSVGGLDTQSIVFGRTLADPTLKAYVVSPASVDAMPEGLSDEQAWTAIDRHLAYAGMEETYAGDLPGPSRAIYRPLGDILRYNLNKTPGLLDRLRRFYFRRRS